MVIAQKTGTDSVLVACQILATWKCFVGSEDRLEQGLCIFSLRFLCHRSQWNQAEPKGQSSFPLQLPSRQSRHVLPDVNPVSDLQECSPKSFSSSQFFHYRHQNPWLTIAGVILGARTWMVCGSTRSCLSHAGSQNQRMAWVGKDFKDHPVPASLLWDTFH